MYTYPYIYTIFVLFLCTPVLGNYAREDTVYEYASGVFLRVPMDTMDSCYIAVAREIIRIGNIIRCPFI